MLLVVVTGLALDHAVCGKKIDRTFLKANEGSIGSHLRHQRVARLERLEIFIANQCENFVKFVRCSRPPEVNSVVQVTGPKNVIVSVHPFNCVTAFKSPEFSHAIADFHEILRTLRHPVSTCGEMAGDECDAGSVIEGESNGRSTFVPENMSKASCFGSCGYISNPRH